MAAELALNNTKLEKPTIEQIKSNKNGKYKKLLTKNKHWSFYLF